MRSIHLRQNAAEQRRPIRKMYLTLNGLRSRACPRKLGSLYIR